MTAVTTLIVEDRLREAGWVYGEMPAAQPPVVYRGSEFKVARWQHIRFPNDGFSLSDALYLEWQDALQRAGRADHAIETLRGKLALLCLGVLVALVSFVSGVAYFK